LSLPPVEAKSVAAYLGTFKKEPNSYPSSGSNQEIRAQVHFEKVLGCGSCHQARPGQGGLSGPELYTVSERLNRAWAAAFITEPTYWNAVPMPKISIRGEQLAAISDYLFQHPAEKPAPTGKVKEEGHPAGKSRPAPTTRAELLYQVFCSQCHGIQGNGKGVNAPSMFISPRNHTSQEEMGMLTDDRLYAAIRYGGTAVGKSTLMPPWGGVLKDTDIKALVEYIRILSNTGTGREQ
jgi:cytochrome c oxidase cbb3-type subunit 3